MHLSTFLESIKKQKLHILILLFYVLSAVYITFPLVLQMGRIATNTKDELLVSWIQVSMFDNLIHNPLHLFEGKIFYPYINSLAYSEPFITSSIISALPVYLAKQPITSLNFTFFSSLVLLGFSMYLLTFAFTKNLFPSVISGLLVMFSPAVLDKNVHVQVLTIYWVPLSVLFFYLFLKKRMFRYFLLTCLCFLAQTYNSFLPGYFILTAISVLFVLWLHSKKKKATYYINAKHLVTIATTFLLLIPIVLPYFAVSQEFHYVRDIRETVHLSLQPEDLWYPNDLTRLYKPLRAISGQDSYPPFTEFKVGYLGVVFSLLAIVTILYSLRYFAKRNLFLRFCTITALIGLLLSLGPALHLGRKTIHEPFLIPLPYAILYYIVPGFQGMRASYRWEMLFILFIAGGSGIVLSLLINRVKSRFRIPIYIVIALGIVLEFNYPMRFIPVPQISEFPSVYSYLRGLPKESVIVEMPIYNWSMSPYSHQELFRLYYATYHQKRTLNGASGFSPPPWQKFVTGVLADFPSERSINQLREKEIEYIVIHKKEYDELAGAGFTVVDKKIPDGETVVDKLFLLDDVELVGKFKDDIIFRIKTEV